MVHDRRRFIKLGLAGTAAVAAGCGTSNEASPEETPAPATVGPGGPVLLSTWRHGLIANDHGQRKLNGGGSILDAVEQGVSVVEADFTNRSVGLGGLPDRDGIVTLDACIMDHAGRAGSVAFVRGFIHPIRIARAVMERTPHVMLVGAGAERWAREQGFTEMNVEVPEVRQAWEEWKKKGEYKPVANIENHDTIGMLGLDAAGTLAGSCTTSGMAWKVHGRVGDSPIIGAGLFVDGDVGAACATGVGELVIRIAGSHAVVEMMRQGMAPEEACREAVRRILRKNPGLKDQQVGFIALRRDGLFGTWSIYPGFDMAVTDRHGTRVVVSGAELEWGASA
ncbi:MAG: N(4)-(beta-N-acetylglucosaminyl)-L-asparaginase [Flavobacteriales bacterium]|nr:N(4)-(beta-N-acetylglucosaminyl)-L-asparaginase [Flavobacteriales bacterium]